MSSPTHCSWTYTWAGATQAELGMGGTVQTAVVWLLRSPMRRKLVQAATDEYWWMTRLTLARLAEVPAHQCQLVGSVALLSDGAAGARVIVAAACAGHHREGVPGRRLCSVDYDTCTALTSTAATAAA